MIAIFQYDTESIKIYGVTWPTSSLAILYALVYKSDVQIAIWNVFYTKFDSSKIPKTLMSQIDS